MLIDYLLVGIMCLLLTVILTPVVIIVARKVGAIDYPGEERRVHSKPIPRLGGVAMYLAFVITTLYFLPHTSSVNGLLLGATVILAVGIYDDIKGVSPKAKLLGQIASAAVLLFFGYQIQSLTLPVIGPLNFIAPWGYVFVILWVVSLINTVNLTDGLDGLAAGICFGACMVLLVSAVKIRSFQEAYLMAALAGCCLGFLFFNFHPAKVFMGDSGSMFLGFILAGVSVTGLLKTPALFGLVLPLLALGMPIFDMTFAVIRRKWKGQPISLADRGHFHHRLLDMGLSHREAVLALYLLSATLGGAALFASVDNWRWAIILTVTVGMILVSLLLGKNANTARRSSGK
ncbi:MAG TPA: MraY family glycosyltransferase [Candidatus Deferrimicrobium sp.]|nr:MraY family glycosyltransferase [Candidatus Deferrimicrobium sp.]